MGYAEDVLEESSVVSTNLDGIDEAPTYPLPARIDSETFYERDANTGYARRVIQSTGQYGVSGRTLRVTETKRVRDVDTPFRNAMRDRMLLSAPVQETVYQVDYAAYHDGDHPNPLRGGYGYTNDSLGTLNPYASTVTTYREFDLGAPPDPDARFGQLFAWKPSHTYSWITDDPTQPVPAFNEWDATTSQDQGGWTYQGRALGYDYHGRLVESEDATGVKVSLTYGGVAQSQLLNATATSPLGTTPMSLGISYDYDDFGRPIRTTDPSGSTTEFSYDAQGRLAESRDALGRVVASQSYLFAKEHGSASYNHTQTVTYALGNLLGNASFEIKEVASSGSSQIAAWATGAGSPSLSEKVTGAVLGTNYMVLGDATPGHLAQSVTVEPEQVYVVSGWFRRHTSNGGGGAISLFAGNGQRDDIEVLGYSSGLEAADGAHHRIVRETSTSGQGADWRQQWVRFRTTTSTTVEVGFSTAASGQSVRVDATAMLPLDAAWTEEEWQAAMQPLVSTAYLDAWTEQQQTVVAVGSYLGAEERVAFTERDEWGSPVRAFLPIETDGGSDVLNAWVSPSSVLAEAQSFYDGGTDARGVSVPDAGGRPFAETSYYNDTARRPRTVVQPGTSTEVVQLAYGTQQFTLTGQDSWRQVAVEEAVDPGGRTVFSYTDADGHQVLSRTLGAKPDSLQTAASHAADSNQEVIVGCSEPNSGSRQADLDIDPGDLYRRTVRSHIVESPLTVVDHEPFWYRVQFDADGEYIGATGGGQIDGDARGSLEILAPDGSEQRIVFQEQFWPADVRAPEQVVREGVVILPPGQYTVRTMAGETNDGCARMETTALLERSTTTTMVQTEFEYDVFGNLTRVFHPNFFDPSVAQRQDFVTTHAYDNRGLLLETTTPDTDRPALFKYDRAGRLRFQQNPDQTNDKVTVLTYDALGRPVRTSAGPIGTAFEALDPEQTYALESMSGKRLSETQYDDAPNLSAFPWNRFRDAYNGNPPLAESRAPNPALALVNSLENTTGRVAATAYKSDGSWRFEFFSYDAVGQVTRRHVVEQHGAPTTAVYTYAYDAAGQVLSRTVEIGSETLV
ncbi:MAG: hypothetical protein AAGN64_04225, partial [Bacteroidota bacterium]